MNLIYDVVKHPLSSPIPKKFRGVLKALSHCGYSLDYYGLSIFRDFIYKEIYIYNKSPETIKNELSITYSDFGMFIKTSLGIKLKDLEIAKRDSRINNGTALCNSKSIYKNECKFTFNPYLYTDIKGYHLLIKNGMYHPINNPSGMVRDHIISKEYGWKHSISPKLISNHHNCQYLTNLENLKKGTKSGMSVKELEHLIANNHYYNIPNLSVSLPKTDLHKKKISITNSKYMSITNGSENKRVLKNTDIPFGYTRGMTRNKDKK